MTDPNLYLQTPVSLSAFKRETNFSPLLFLQSIQPKLLQNSYSRFVRISPFYLDVVNWPKVDKIWALSGWWLTTGSLSDGMMHIVKTLITMAMVVWYYHPSQWYFSASQIMFGNVCCMRVSLLLRIENMYDIMYNIEQGEGCCGVFGNDITVIYFLIILS